MKARKGNTIMIIVNRQQRTNYTTPGIITYNGGETLYSIEPGPAWGKGPIPAGIYSVRLRTFGEFNTRYALRFPAFHRGMLEICDVPGFDAVLAHCGNSFVDTHACLLVGMRYVNCGLQESARAYEKLYRAVVADAAAGTLTIEYKNA
jgi:hypothetical protein